MSKPRSLQRVFADSGNTLAQLLSRASALSELDRRFQRQLPPSFRGHVMVANLRDGVLILQTSSAEWRTRIHFLAPRLLEAIRIEVPSVTELRIRVVPDRTPEKPTGTRTPTLSPTSADTLAKTAASTDDNRLRQSLARLAARFRG